MEIIRDLSTCVSAPQGTAVSIGQYDGVHLGHQSVVAALAKDAVQRGLETAVVTFDRHPASVVRPDSAPKLLTDLPTKLELLEAAGIDRTVVITFDEEQSKQPAEEFVRRVLHDCLQARTVTVGQDFHFGHGRSGDVRLLEEMGSALGFIVTGMELVSGAGSLSGSPISSTAIRQALAAGRLSDANAMLGRPHELRGVVHTGDQRGRELGFPTANVAVSDELQLPADGIYAGWYVRPDGQRYATAISLGRRPTFYESADVSLLEAHLLDFEGDLYGESAVVQFVERLRGEERFDSLEDLVAQIGRDCERAAKALE